VKNKIAVVLLVIILLVLGMYYCPSRFYGGSSPLLAETISKMAECGDFHGPRVGIGDIKSPQWAGYELICDSCNDNDLLTLTMHPNGAVRGYAFRAMIVRGHKDTFRVLKRLIKDDEIACTIDGCFIGGTTVSGYCLEVTHKESSSFWRCRFTDDELAEIESMVLFDPDCDKYVRWYLLQQILRNEDTYSRLRTHIKSNNSRINLKQPAKDDSSQRPEEIALWAMYVELAQQKTGKSRELMEKNLEIANEKERAMHAKFITLALQRFPDKECDKLLEKIRASNLDKTIVREDGLDGSSFSEKWFYNHFF
jgi:hypothetical protein